MRDHLRGNVVAYLALFFALSGGAYAVTAPKNTIMSKSIKDGQVRSIDLGPNAVTAAKLAHNAVSGAHVVNDSLTGSDIDEATLSLPSSGAAPSGLAGGDLTGSYPDPAIAANAVGGDEVAAGSLAGSDLGSNAITGTQVDEATLSTVPSATTAGSATTAASATDSLQLGGFSASAFVRSTTAIPGGDLGGSYASPTLKTNSVSTAILDDLPGASLRNPQSGGACGGTALPVPDFTEGHLLFSAQDYDVTGDMVAPCGALRYLTAPVPGTYVITANVQWEPGAAGTRRVALRRNGAAELAVVEGPPTPGDARGAHGTSQTVTAIARMSAGDGPRVYVLQSSGSALDVIAGSIAMSWIGP